MKKRKFGDGGDIDTMDTDNSADVRAASDAADKQYKDSMTFKDAFAEARKAGDGTFEWQGKKYTTDMAKPAAKPAPKPAASDLQRFPPAKLSVNDHRRMQNKELADKVKSAVRGNNMPPMRPVAGVNSEGKMNADTQLRMGQRNPSVNFKSGGKVGGASRGDGIAQRGKTRGKLC